MPDRDDRQEPRPEAQTPFMARPRFVPSPNAAPRRDRNEPAIRSEGQPQTTLASVQQRRAAALRAQRQQATQRALIDDVFRAELARLRQLCQQNREADTCPPECVVRQWLRGALNNLNGLEELLRQINGGWRG